MIFTILWPIFHMFMKELLEIRRDNILKVAIILPVIEVLLLGYVNSTDLKKIQTMLCDQDNSTISRSFLKKFQNSEYFDIKYYTTQSKEILPAFSRNLIKFCVRVPKNFAKDIKEGKTTEVQLIANGTTSHIVSFAFQRAAALITDFSTAIYSKQHIAIQNRTGKLPYIKTEERIWYNLELKSSTTIMPDAIGLLIVVVPLIVASLALVREKESGNIEQILVAPIKPYQIVLGKILPYIFVVLADFALITAISFLLFDLPFRGSPFLYVFSAIFMIIANLGIGILISTLCSTQQQVMLWDIFVVVPNLVLSGLLCPIKNLPAALQLVTYFIPYRYYIVINKGIMLKGLGAQQLLPEITALIIFSCTIFFIAIKRFKKTVA